MTQYILRRLLIALPVLFGITIVIFLIVRVVPGDPAIIMAGQDATEEQIEKIRAYLGLDKLIFVQYGIFIGNLLQGDLGTSSRTGLPVELVAKFFQG